MLTQPGVEIAWDVPSQQVTSIGEDEDYSALATTQIAVSGDSTTDSPSLVARADNADLLDDGFPALWSVDKDHTKVSVQSTLDGYAAAGAVRNHDPLVLRPVTVRADDPDHPLGSYEPGDRMQLAVEEHPWIPPGSYTQRITEIAPHLVDVKLTVGEAP